MTRQIALLAGFVFLLFSSALAFAQEGGKVDWTKVGRAGTEYKEALKDAKAKKLPIMIFFTCGCKPCQRFGSGPLSDTAVVDTSKKFIRLFIKGSKELQEKHKVDGCPTMVFLKSDGTEAKTIIRDDVLKIKAEDLKKQMDEVLKPPEKKPPAK